MMTQRRPIRSACGRAGGLALLAWLGLIGMRAAEAASSAAPSSATASAPSSAATCAGCHGDQGEGNAASGFPRLAGLPAAYVHKQLAAYANGQRNNAVMSPLAKGLNADQQRALAAYFSALGEGSGTSRPASATTTQAPRATSRGALLATRGDEALKVQACANCHGPGGEGEGPLVPPLGGQHASYLEAALKEWKDGSRQTDPSGQMPGIAHALSDADAQALAAYYAGLPASWAHGMMPLPAVAKPNTVPSGPRTTTATAPRSPQGVGVEPPGLTTGGSQGPGGGGGGTGGGPSGSKGSPP